MNEKGIEKKIDEVQDLVILTNPVLVPILFHEKKKQILEMLVQEELTLKMLSKKTSTNPGIIKRHLTDLLNNNLITISRIETNKYSVNMKFYRSIAKKFKIDIDWP
jgi:DNA-binding transcriptional ArsR family regulator